MRYAGPLPFPVETLGDLWDLPDAVRAEIERVQAEEAGARRMYDDQCDALESSEEQTRYASTLLDNLDTELQRAASLPDFRKTFARLVRESDFERN
jgi:hypothetical protein